MMPKPSIYLPIRTEVYRDDYEWASRVAAKHGVTTDAVLRMALAHLRGSVIAEIVSIASIKSSVRENGDGTPER